MNIAGKIQTVLGTISPEKLGVTLTHEHLLIDLSVVYDTPMSASEKGFFNSPVSLDSRSWPNGMVSSGMFLGKPLVVHLPSRPGKIRIGNYVSYIRIPDFSRIHYIR